MDRGAWWATVRGVTKESDNDNTPKLPTAQQICFARLQTGEQICVLLIYEITFP